MIDHHGIYPDMSEAEYHGDPFKGGSLSSSEARLVNDCPAKLLYRRQTGETCTAVFDFGKAAHAMVLEAGPEIVVVEHDNWRTNDAKAQHAEAHAAGRVPLLRKDYTIVEAMAAELRAHPLVPLLLRPGNGIPEASLFWPDRSGVTLRARVDWLPDKPVGKRMIVSDYKTARSADPADFGRAAASYGYHQQNAWYLDGVETLMGVVDPAFVFIVQEKEPPYLVTVIELDPTALQIGRERNRRAIERYVECVESGVWPGYATEVAMASLPKWAEYQHADEFSADYSSSF